MATPKKTEQELLDFALAQVPETGEIVYRDLWDKIRKSDYPEAASMLPELKKRGLVTAKVEHIGGVVKHTYQRAG